MRIAALLLTALALAGTTEAQINLTGRGNRLTNMVGQSAGSTCSSSTFCTPFVLTGPSGSTLFGSVQGGNGGNYVVYASVGLRACPAPMPTLGVNLLQSPLVVIASGTLGSGGGGGCPGIASYQFSVTASAGTSFYVQSRQQTPGGQFGFTTVIRVDA